VVPLRFRDTPKDAIKTGPFVPVTVVPDVADTSKPKGAASHQLAMLGLPFAFASHFAPEELHRALRVYRKTFRPSATLKKPYVMIGVPVVTAETNDRALFLATTPLLRILKRVRNESMELQPPIEPQEMEKLWTYHERLAVYERFGIAAVGSVQTVRDKLASLLESTEADELMIVSDL
jgi:alkanesulfonate monooxygenase SsuD/methylene tetrahydromethanopterin reductase-like flavin-dependent oxidoreductase (luciferase family)